MREAARTLPEPLLAEVLDFAEFLQAQLARGQEGAQGVSLADLCGGVESSSTFGGSPQVIQEWLRDEWR